MSPSPIFLALAGLAIAAPLSAQTRNAVGARVRTEFAAADRDHDGELSRGEVTQRIVRTYGPTAMSTARSRILTNFWYNRLDRDHDAKVTRGEAQASANEMFARFDTNRNGRIDPRERPAMQAFLRNPAR